MSHGRIYAILDKLKHDAQMNEMSEILERNAKVSELMTSSGAQAKHVGFIGGMPISHPRPHDVI